MPRRQASCGALASRRPRHYRVVVQRVVGFARGDASVHPLAGERLPIVLVRRWADSRLYVCEGGLVAERDVGGGVDRPWRGAGCRAVDGRGGGRGGRGGGRDQGVLGEGGRITDFVRESGTS